jgi:acyl-ACP thioesterase
MEPRVFVSRRAVHGTDVGLDGRLRLDALARYLQAAAEGDLAGAELVRATAVWAAIDSESGRPCPLGPDFLRVYGPSAAGRTVSARLSHPRPPEQADEEPWPLRAADFDASGHVNNAVYWAAVEDAVAGLGWLPAVAEVEYHRPALPGCEPRLVCAAAPGEAEAWAWLLTDGQRLASARMSAR